VAHDPILADAGAASARPGPGGAGRLRGLLGHAAAEEARDQAREQTAARGRADVAVVFADSAASLRRRWPGAARAAGDGGRVWVAWPKKTSGLATDLGEREVREHGLSAGFVDFKICAIDSTWSGLAFARRRG